MASIYIYKYNNYFNRIVKKEDNLSDYGSPIYSESLVNFNPSDGVDTVFIAGRSDKGYYGGGDYFIYSEDNLTPSSRWFIIQDQRTRKGQSQLTLHRDVIVDHYDSVIEAPVYIQKATLENNDPFIFNKEGSGYNQIKTSETLLKDKYHCKWLVAYLNKNRTETYTFTTHTYTSTPDITVNSLSNWWANRYVLYKYYYEYTGIDATLYVTNKNLYKRPTYLTYDKDFSLISISAGDDYKVSESNRTATRTSHNQIKDGQAQSLASLLAPNFVADSGIKVYTKSQADELDALNRKVILVSSTGKMYRINTKTTVAHTRTTVKPGTDLYNALKKYFEDTTGLYWDSNASTSITPLAYDIKGLSTYLELTEVNPSALSYTIPASASKKGCLDQAYDIMMVPYDYEGEQGQKMMYMRVEDDSMQFLTFSNEGALELMTQIASNTKLCLDVQILPYLIPTGEIDYHTYTQSGTTYPAVLGFTQFEGKDDIDIIVNKGYGIPVYWPSSSSFRTTITLDEPIYVTEPKIQNECDLYRFVSPNYSSAFDFNVAMNGGLSTVEINGTYLPYQPYIHVNPTFSGLYGADFDDQRGLVCGGNYSISASSDAWKDYVTSNKNYSEIFDREIQNMEVNREVQKTQELAGYISGAIGGAAAGAISGSYVSPSPISSGIGALVGGAASVAGAVIDAKASQKLYDESKSYKTDMQNYSLQNIQALPNTLTRTSAYNVDNKYYPFIEYYTCTDEEKEALRNQIKYTGMTVNRVGCIKNYIKDDYSYIQGKLIRMEDLNDEYHMITAIGDELIKGVYIR